MADTTFINQQTVIQADWLNDVNNATYFKNPPATTPLDPADLVNVQQGGVAKVVQVGDLSSREAADIGFTPTGSLVPAPATNLSAYLNISVIQLDSGWGVSTANPNNNVAINYAMSINKGKSFFLPPQSTWYPTTDTIVMPSGTTLAGGGWNTNGLVENYSELRCTDAAKAVVSLDDGTAFPAYQTLVDLNLRGGLHSVITPDTTDPFGAHSGLVIRPRILRVGLISPAEDCVRIAHGAEEFLMRDFFFVSPGKNGLHAVGKMGAPVNNYVTSSRFEIAEISAAEWGVLLESTVNGLENCFDALVMRGTGSGGVRGGAIKFAAGSVFSNTYLKHLSIEYIGGGFNRPFTETTGSISIGTNILTVADGTNIVNGRPITVMGAGSTQFAFTGAMLQTTVVSGGGTNTLILADNATTTVVGGYVTDLYLDAIEFAVGSSGSTLIEGSQIGTYDARFAINNRAHELTLRNNPSMGGSVYNENGTTYVLGALGASVLTPAGIGSQLRGRVKDTEYGGQLNNLSPHISPGNFPAITCGMAGVGHRVKLIGNTPFVPFTGTYGKAGYAKNTGAGEVDMWTVDGDTNTEEVRDVRFAVDEDVQAFSNGGAYELWDNWRGVTNSTDTTIASFTITTNDNPVPGEVKHITTCGAITSLTLVANTGQNLAASLTGLSLAANSSLKIRFSGPGGGSIWRPYGG